MRREAHFAPSSRRIHMGEVMEKAKIKGPTKRKTASLADQDEKYSMLLAYDVPCYGTIEFRANSDAAAARKGQRMLKDWDKHLGNVAFVDEQEGADEHRIVSLTHRPTQRTVAEDLYMEPQSCPKVIIHVAGGVADYYVQGNVAVELIDIDNIDAGDPPVELDDSWRELTKGLFSEDEAKYVRFVKRKK
jgi:hypothetical protein